MSDFIVLASDSATLASAFSDFFTVSVIVATLASGIRLAVPFLFAALGRRWASGPEC